MRGGPPQRSARLKVSAAVAVAGVVSVALGSCISPSPGQSPPSDSFFFPTGLAMSPGRKVLFVANSDFDLQYNGGTVLALDFAALRARILEVRGALEQSAGSQDACAAIGLPKNDNRLLNPAPCGAINQQPFVRNFATIGAFASGEIVVQRPAGIAGTRLFVPVRGDPSLTYFDITDDSDPAKPYGPCIEGGAFCLDCGQGSAQGGRCADAHRIGGNPTDNARGLTLPVEPVGVAATTVSGGNILVVAHQTLNAASLVTNPWAGTANPWTPADHPALQFTFTGLPNGPTEVASIPEPAIVTASRASAGGGIVYEPGFLVTFRGAAEVDLLRYHVDDADPSRPFLTHAGGVGIATQATGDDSRGIALDASQRQECESSCSVGARGGLVACLTACAAIPLRFFVANRAPASLLVGQVQTVLTQTSVGGGAEVASAFDLITVYEAIPLSYGPSHVVLGHVIDREGKPQLRVFTVAFDSRAIFSYDPDARRVDQVIRTGRGPHAIAFDTGDDGDGQHSLLLVGHFTDSYLGVVDLDMRHDYTFGSMFANVGEPLEPKESK
jgi:hypothetical protein